MLQLQLFEFSPEFLLFINLGLVLGFLLLCFMFFYLLVIKQGSYSIIFLYFTSSLYYWVLSDGFLLNASPYSFNLKISFFFIFLLCWLFFGLYQCGSLINLCDFFEERLNNHSKEIFGLETFALIWYIHKQKFQGKDFIENANGKICLDFLIFAWFIIFVFTVKEILKKFLYLFILTAFYKYGFGHGIFYSLNYLLVIFLISLIGIDKDIACFINHYFGPYVLGWIGSYQYIGVEQGFIFVSAKDWKWTIIKSRLEAKRKDLLSEIKALQSKEKDKL